MKLRPHPFNSRPPQQGIALLTVLVLLLLSLTAVLGALRYSNLNEAMLGNTSDYNRTFAAAEALIRDAEIDIRGRRPPYTPALADGTRGTPCRPAVAAPLTTEAGFLGCRNRGAGAVYFPLKNDLIEALDRVVAASPVLRCSAGICAPLNTTDLANFENNPATLAAMTVPGVGARYGQFTRFGLPALVAGEVNPALTHPDSRYWVEAFTYNESLVTNDAKPDENAPYVYRITAIAYGQKDGTRVVIRSIFVPYPALNQNI